MSLHWDLAEPAAPPRPPPGTSRRFRRRTVAAALGLALVVVLTLAALESWQRQARRSAAEHEVLGAAELEQQALATNDVELLSPIVPPGVNQLGRIHLVQDAQAIAPGVATVGGRGQPGAVRLYASQPGGALDRAEVDVRTVISDHF